MLLQTSRRGASQALKRQATLASPSMPVRALSVAKEPTDPATASSQMNAFWMPFTPNTHFKNKPRLLTRSKGMYYWTADGQKILDGTAGLWYVSHHFPFSTY